MRISPELKAEVRKEAEALREQATDIELERLNFNRLEPMSRSYCIYGQIAGDCRSQRATELLKACATPYSESLYVRPAKLREEKRRKVTFEPKALTYFSPIEVYIVNEGAKRENLVSYLKGETSELEL